MMKGCTRQTQIATSGNYKRIHLYACLVRFLKNKPHWSRLEILAFLIPGTVIRLLDFCIEIICKGNSLTLAKVFVDPGLAASYEKKLPLCTLSVLLK